MPLIPFPNVPDDPGVPPLLRQGLGFLQANFPGVALLTGDDPAVGGLTGLNQWGIFDNDGNLVVEADSVVAFEYAKEYRVSNYPVEEGGFASYNKVEMPYSSRLLLARGGSDADRADFLDAIEAVEASLDLFMIITPNRSYVDANVVRASYSRHAQAGATLITAELQVEEIRPAASATFTNTASPSGTASQSGGTVQPQPPALDQSTAAALGYT